MTIRFFAVCEQKIYIFNFNSFEIIDVFDTFENPKGLISISYDIGSTVVAYPDKEIGCVRVKWYEKSVTSLISSHENAISYISLSNDGRLLATSSERGTLIRVYESETGTFLQEFRRGKEKAEINYICFGHSHQFVSATSDRGTIHVWSLYSCIQKLKKETNKLENEVSSNNENLPPNRESIFKKLPNFFSGGFFKSEWSFVRIKVQGQKSICCFCEQDLVIAIDNLGNYYNSK